MPQTSDTPPIQQLLETQSLQKSSTATGSSSLIDQLTGNPFFTAVCSSELTLEQLLTYELL
jgi:hypothetical protein